MDVIQEAVERIGQEFSPEKVILFGSYADGTATEDSDVDILVILPFMCKNLDKSVEILTRIDPHFPTDVLVRRPEDVQRQYEMGDPLIRDALDNGVVLYEQSR
jgi:predicted nucleotidyltransferase